MLSEIYSKIHGWLFLTYELERDIVTFPPYDYSQSFDKDGVNYFDYLE